MFESIGIFILVTVIGFFWALGRLFQYSFGKYSDYIIVPPLAWISLIIGIWVPFLSYIVLAYILFWCKSAETLMNIRTKAISNLTPKDIIENANNQIVQNNLISDEWVINTWNNLSEAEWIEKISLNKTFLEQALDYNMEVHASEAEPYVAWVEVVKYYLYLDKNSKVNITEEKI